jgi:hypothetical protein
MSKDRRLSREPDLLLGDLESDHVAIWVESRPYRDAQDFWDANWLETPIEVAAGKFRARVPASLRADELRRFSLGLEEIDRLAAREATLESLEDWLHLKVTIAPVGAVTVSGDLVDAPGTGNQLRFTLGADLHLAHVGRWIDQLKRIEVAYPIVGNPQPVFPRPVE